MDCRGLAGEKPTMPAPPKVCPLVLLVLVPKAELPPILLLVLPLESVELPVVEVEEPDVVLESVELNSELLPPRVELELPPVGPAPAIIDPPAEPVPARG
jgi:hypothetical protein